MYTVIDWRVRVITVAMETQKVFPSVLLSIYSRGRTALNNINVLGSSCKVPDTVHRFLPNLDFPRQIFLEVPNI